MIGRIGRNENIQLIVLTLAILLYLLIQVAESADHLSGQPDQHSIVTMASASTPAMTVEESQSRHIDPARVPDDSAAQSGVQK